MVRVLLFKRRILRIKRTRNLSKIKMLASYSPCALVTLFAFRCH